MSRHHHVLSILLLLLLAFGGCRPEPAKRNGRFTVVATTGIIADAVRNIAKDSADVSALMLAGVDPHLYKATVRDIEAITGADVVFYGGLHLEGKMQDVLRKAGRFKTIVAVTDGIPRQKLIRLTETGDNYDPHIWFDVQLWQQCVRQMSRTLQENDAPNAAYYRQNAETYLRKLDSLDAKAKNSISRIPKTRRVLITAHDAFEYFGRAYNMEVKGLQGISTLSEYGLKDVTLMVDMIVRRDIWAIFVETSVPRKAIEAVTEGCRARGHPIVIGGNLYSDALGGPGSGADTYEGMVLANLRTITESLK